MRPAPANFIFRIISQSTEVGLRRLRAITAPLGGNAFVHTTIADAAAGIATDSPTPTLCAVDSGCQNSVAALAEYLASGQSLGAPVGAFNLSRISRDVMASAHALPRLVFALEDLENPLLDNPFGKVALSAALKAWASGAAIDAGHFLSWAPLVRRLAPTKVCEEIRAAKLDLRMSDQQIGQHALLADIYSPAGNLQHFTVMTDGVTLASAAIIGPENSQESLRCRNALRSGIAAHGGGLLLVSTLRSGETIIQLLTRLAACNASTLVGEVGGVTPRHELRSRAIDAQNDEANASAEKPAAAGAPDPKLGKVG